MSSDTKQVSPVGRGRLVNAPPRAAGGARAGALEALMMQIERTIRYDAVRYDAARVKGFGKEVREAPGCEGLADSHPLLLNSAMRGGQANALIGGNR